MTIYTHAARGHGRRLHQLRRLGMPSDSSCTSHTCSLLHITHSSYTSHTCIFGCQMSQTSDASVRHVRAVWRQVCDVSELSDGIRLWCFTPRSWYVMTKTSRLWCFTQWLGIRLWCFTRMFYTKVVICNDSCILMHQRTYIHKLSQLWTPLQSPWELASHIYPCSRRHDRRLCEQNKPPVQLTRNRRNLPQP